MQKYRSRRLLRRKYRKSKRNFVISLILIGILIFATLNWVLPNFIGGLGEVKNVIQPSKNQVVQEEDSAIAPPVLNIPYEATNTAQINIPGFGTPATKVNIYVDEEIKDTVSVSQDGSFVGQNISLNIGTNNIFGKTVDEKGKTSLPSKTLKIQYIFEKPGLQIFEPEDNKKIQGGDKKVRVAGKVDPGIKVFINNSQTIVANDGNFSLDLPINDGDNIITIKALDTATNAVEIERRVNYTPQETQ